MNVPPPVSAGLARLTARVICRMMIESPLRQGLGLGKTTSVGQVSVSSAGIVQVAIQKANDIQQAFLADPTVFWEGSADGCFARAVLMVGRQAMSKPSFVTIDSVSEVPEGLCA